MRREQGSRLRVGATEQVAKQAAAFRVGSESVFLPVERGAGQYGIDAGFGRGSFAAVFFQDSRGIATHFGRSDRPVVEPFEARGALLVGKLRLDPTK